MLLTVVSDLERNEGFLHNFLAHFPALVVVCSALSHDKSKEKAALPLHSREIYSPRPARQKGGPPSPVFLSRLQVQGLQARLPLAFESKDAGSVRATGLRRYCAKLV
jgi:hypothetical protein